MGSKWVFPTRVAEKGGEARETWNEVIIWKFGRQKKGSSEVPRELMQEKKSLSTIKVRRLKYLDIGKPAEYECQGIRR